MHRRAGRNVPKERLVAVLDGVATHVLPCYSPTVEGMVMVIHSTVLLKYGVFPVRVLDERVSEKKVHLPRNDIAGSIDIWSHLQGWLHNNASILFADG